MLLARRVQGAHGARYPYESEEPSRLCHAALARHELLAHLQAASHPSRREFGVDRAFVPCLFLVSLTFFPFIL